ncbi:hypothetical protein [Nocardioides halotolerans]|jgi:hypothetical protein|nr:hypothetical protein [Nocardioides halotolerans]
MAPFASPDRAATRWRPPLDEDSLRTIRRARALKRRRRARRVLTRV